MTNYLMYTTKIVLCTKVINCMLDSNEIFKGLQYTFFITKYKKKNITTQTSNFSLMFKPPMGFVSIQEVLRNLHFCTLSQPRIPVFPCFLNLRMSTFLMGVLSHCL